MRDDALPIRRVLLSGAGIACAVALAIGAVALLLAHRGVAPGGAPVSKPAALGDGIPMLQAAPQDELAAYRREKAQALDGLGWVDAASGVAHVPIATAMDVLAARAASGASR
jgi:hypothetical protein